MNRIIIILLLSILNLTSCFTSNGKSNEGFISRLHTPNEPADWYRILGPTTIDKHWADFKAIDWEKEYWKEDASGDDNPSFIEVIDTLNNVHLSISTFPLNRDAFQFSIWVGSRGILDDNGQEIEKGFVECYLLNSNDSGKVKALMDIFFKRNYDLFFNKINKLEFRFKIEEDYYNIK